VGQPKQEWGVRGIVDGLLDLKGTVLQNEEKKRNG